MGFVDWHEAAKAIRDRHPAPDGETFGFEEQGVYFELADSYGWAGEEEGEIVQTIEAFDADGNAAKRVRRIPRPGS
jgi:hypothetical protein